MARAKVLKYGPLTVQVSPGRRDPGPGERDWTQRYSITVSEGEKSVWFALTVDHDEEEIPIAERMAAWRAIDALRGAYRDPDVFEEGSLASGDFGPKATKNIIAAAFDFGGQALEDAFGDALVESQRLGKVIERGGPKEWLPGADLSGRRGTKEWTPRGGPEAPLLKGQRVVLRRDVDRYPDFQVQKGAKGEVAWFSYGTDGQPDFIAVRMDEHIPGAEQWSNEVHWYGDFVDDYWQDVRPVRS